MPKRQTTKIGANQSGNADPSEKKTCFIPPNTCLWNKYADIEEYDKNTQHFLTISGIHSCSNTPKKETNIQTPKEAKNLNS